MKRYAQSRSIAAPGEGALSIEQYKHVTGDNYSAEEAAIDAAEAQDSAAEVQAVQEEIEQVADVADSMEDVQELISDGEPLTDREAQLVAVAGDLAYAGVPEGMAEPIVPEVAVESYIKNKVSFEGRISDAIKDFWRYIKEMLAKAWKKIKEFYNKYFGPVKRFEKTFEALKKKASEFSGRKIRDNQRTFDLRSGVATLSVDYKALKNAGEILKNGEHFTAALDRFLATGTAKGASVVVNAAISAINDFDPDNPTAATTAVTNLVGIVDGSIQKVVAGSFYTRDTSVVNPGDYEFYRGTMLFGEHAPTVRVHSAVTKAGHQQTLSLTALLEAVNKSSMAYRVYESSGHHEKPSEVVFTVMTPTEMEDMCEQAIKWTRLMTTYSNGRVFADLEKDRARLEKATDGLQSRFDKFEKRSDSSGVNNHVGIGVYREFVRLNSVVLSNYGAPAVAIQRHALQVLSAYASVIRSNMNCYE